MKGRLVLAMIALSMLGISSQDLTAQDPTFGLRVGFGASESALIVGVHAGKPLGGIDGLHGEVVGQLSLGSQDPLDYKVLEVIPRLKLKVAETNSGLTPFGFVGISLFRFSVDEPITPIGDLGLSRTDVGLSVGGGVEKNGFSLEGALGLSTISTLQVLLSYGFSPG